MSDRDEVPDEEENEHLGGADEATSETGEAEDTAPEPEEAPGVDPEVFEELKARENERIKRTSAMGAVLQNMMNALASRTTNNPLDQGTLIATFELFERIYGIWARGELTPLTWVIKERPRTKVELETALRTTRQVFEYIHQRTAHLYKDYLFVYQINDKIERLAIGTQIDEEIGMMKGICRSYGLGEEDFAILQEVIRRQLIETYPILIEIISLAMRDINSGRAGSRGSYNVLNL